jgi:molybdopterin synthase catalytic subunit
VIRIQREDFDVAGELAAMTAARPAIGAVCCFLGLVRDLSDDRRVQAMTLEHYPGMTEKALAGIEAEARRRWPLIDALIIHRFGRLLPADRIVLVVAAAAHRKDAFEACQFLADWLKTKAPFWKKEETAAGARWVEVRASDVEAARRWRQSPSPGSGSRSR